MKKQLLLLAGIVSLIVGQSVFGWTLSVMSDPKNSRDALVEIILTSAAGWTGCKNSTFTLTPGQSRQIDASGCDLKRIKVRHMHNGQNVYGDDLVITSGGKNPVKGVRIITVDRGLKTEKLRAVTNENYWENYMTQQERVDAFNKAIKKPERPSIQF